jgi:hypothetical protein
MPKEQANPATTATTATTSSPTGGLYSGCNWRTFKVIQPVRYRSMKRSWQTHMCRQEWIARCLTRYICV